MKRLSWVLAAAAPALLATAFLIGSIPDEEEFRWGVLSSTLHFRALIEGRFLSWTSLLGFGMPQPMVPNFHLHPLLPLLGFVSPGAWMRIFYVVHTIVGAAGMWQVGRTLQFSPVVNGVSVFTFLLATPTQNYALTDFWPSHYLMWTSAPWLLLLGWRLLDPRETRLHLWTALLGASAGLVLANTHPAHIPVYVVVAAAVAAARWRTVLRRWPWLAAAVLISGAIASPNVVQLAIERRVFAEHLGVVKIPDPLPASALGEMLLRPFSRSEHPWQIDVVQSGTRILFFGGPFAVLAIVGLVGFGRRHVDLALGAIAAALLLFTPSLPLTFLSRFHFRDPLLLCAIPLAGLAADLLVQRRVTRALAHLLMAAQVVIVTAATLPFLDLTSQRDAMDAMWFRGATGEGVVVDRLLPLVTEPGRLAYSPQVDYEVSAGERLPDGIGVNALAYRGIAVVNGLFKGISTDVLWPDDRLFYGRIRIPPQLIESDEALDVLGIRYVLANPGEAVAPGLRERAAIPKRFRGKLVLYENADGWPGAFTTDPGVANLDLPLHPGCSHDRLLCRDLTPLARGRRADEVMITRHGSRIHVNVAGASEPRVLIVAEMFRPEWTARANGQRVQTISVGPGLLGLALPAGTTSVQLDYRPLLLLPTTLLSWSVIAAGLVGVLLWWGRGRPRPAAGARGRTDGPGGVMTPAVL